MENRKSFNIVLKKLNLSQAKEFCDLYASPHQYGSLYYERHADDETYEEFTKRLLWLSKCIYTIRPSSEPKKVIGYCMIYKAGHRRGEVFIRGTLLPEYGNKGLMSEAFKQVLDMAKFAYGVNEVKILMHTINENVLQMVKTLGFTKESDTSKNTVYAKKLRQYIPRRAESGSVSLM
ncbi:GNAT family N-acetyltransferase [Olivibacter sp. SDN3]|uniref:GNAT family N-acetyltransferase n=1 Tax=Olivibacter sp. SDN3 TaxID=2764720 RepID=UPI0016511AB0|nr:GNAT family N-acetyltransferase [Olivibacter sp. SDN3]QNL49016.1 GNAT family N-acetyltransferase [Olivibacter sp. SDN3]